VAASTQSPGVIVQSWVPPQLAEQLKAEADLERRSVSALIRIALEDKLRGDQERRP
jgi:Ribbon-helix-helix protein, copG family